MRWVLLTTLLLSNFACSLDAAPQASTPDPSSTPPAANILWSADHETGDFSQWIIPNRDDVGFQNTGTGIGRITSEVSHSGHFAAELTISNATGAYGNQAVRLFRVSESRQYQEAYYSVWFYFPQRYSTVQWWNVLQFKSRNATNNDAFWQLNVGNRLDGPMHFYLYDWINQRSYTQTIMDIAERSWTHVEVYYKQSAMDEGRISVWQDGILLIDIDRISTHYVDAIETANWSVNNYTNHINPSTATIYIDDAVISTERIGPKPVLFLPYVTTQDRVATMFRR